MKFIKGKISGTYIIELEPHLDKRGFFMRTYDEEIFRQKGLHQKWVQENHSCSTQKGIIRGLHFQFPPYTETKLVRCIRGAVLDVFVDLRNNSSTFGHWDSIELTESNQKMVYIPKGFAHGFCTLTSKSEILYKVDSIYKPDDEGGILWNDPDIAIKWKIDNPMLSEKDKQNMTFKNFVEKYAGIDNNV